MTEEEIGKAVAAKLTGEFYVGQRVRVSEEFRPHSPKLVGKEAVIVKLERNRVYLNPPIVETYWAPYWLEPC